MFSTVIMALFATLFTWFVSALGAAVVLFLKNPRQMQLDLLLGFAAGVMIAASFWSLLQPAIELAAAQGLRPWLTATPAFICGAAFMWAADKAVSLARRQNMLPVGDGGRQRFFQYADLLCGGTAVLPLYFQGTRSRFFVCGDAGRL